MIRALPPLLTLPSFKDHFMVSFFGLLFCSLLATNIFAQESLEPVSKSFLGGVAIDSHDTVAYHEPESIATNQATKGDDDFTVQWKGAKWRFASAESRDLFAANPEKYSPAYNGHCANALSLGEGLIKTDGTHWEIFDDKLYLFYAARGRDRWLGVDDYQTLKSVADRAWEEILRDLSS